MPTSNEGLPNVGRIFYSLNDLFDELNKLTEHEVNLLLSAVTDRVYDPTRAAAIYAMLRGFQTRPR